MDRESRLLTRAMLEEEEPVPAARVAAFQNACTAPCNGSGWWCLDLAATAVYAIYTGYIEPSVERLETAGLEERTC
jgi:hypothetical protein